MSVRVCSPYLGVGGWKESMKRKIMKKNRKKFAVSKKNVTFASAFREMPIGIAEIAQLVEHNLAKVGVAGPSPVFRSTF